MLGLWALTPQWDQAGITGAHRMRGPARLSSKRTMLDTRNPEAWEAVNLDLGSIQGSHLERNPVAGANP
jgi:hypothetical protein